MGRLGLRGFLAHLSYVYEGASKLMGLAAAVLTLIDMGSILSTMPYVTGAPSPSSSPIFFMASMVLALYSLSMVYSFLSELESGHAAFFLSHPLSPLGYVMSWVIACVALPSAVYALCIVASVAIIDPRLLSSIATKEVAYSVLEVAIATLISFLVGMGFKRRSVGFAAWVFTYLLAPFLIPIVAMLVIGSLNPPDEALLVASILAPYKYYTMFAHSAYNISEAAVALSSTVLVVCLVGAIAVYARAVFEVS